jgi:O-antigen/teichoic acid export membrane protein
MVWRQILGYLPLNMVQGLAGFAAIVILTRLLSTEDYGRYALVFALVQLVHVAGFSWLHAAMARFFAGAQRDGTTGNYLATGYAAFFFSAAPIGLLYIVGVIAFAPDPRLETALFFGLGLLIIRALVMMGLEVHKAGQHIARFTTLEAAYSLLGLGFGVALILTSDLAASAPLCGLMLAALLCLGVDLPSQLRGATRGTLYRAKLRRFMAYGIPVSLSLILEQTLLSSDRFLIQYFLGEASVGLYAASHALANRTLDVVFIWLSAGILPLALTALETDGVEKARTILKHYGEILLFITVPAAIGLALVARPLAHVMLGAEFRDAASAIIPWIAAAGLMNGVMTYYVHHAFILAERTSTMAATMIVPTLANLGLNVLLIPWLGLQGALIATVAAYAIGLGICVIVTRHLFPLPLLGASFLRTLLAGAIMAACITALPLSADLPGLFLGIGAGVASYMLAALALNLGDCRTMAFKLSERFDAWRTRQQMKRGI